MASRKDELMSRSGPEDNLAAFETDFNSSSLRTAGNDWAIARTQAFPESQLDYKDVEEQRRLTAQVVSDGPSGIILRDLMTQRYICTKQIYMNELCAEGYKAHQLKQCTPTQLEVIKCGTKLARAVDELCRKPFWAYHACMTKHGQGSKECVPQWTAWDQCTEEF